MRVLEKSRGYFRGTHKGGEIEIQRDPCPGDPDRKFYIIVRWKNGGYLYQGWSPQGVNTMACVQVARAALSTAKEGE